MAAFAIAEKASWQDITIESLAKQAGLSVAVVLKTIHKPEELLPWIVEMIDRKVEESTGEEAADLATHDRLFEMIMARLDIIQPYKKALFSLKNACIEDLDLAKIMATALWRSMGKIIAKSTEKSQSGLSGMARQGALLAIYEITLYQWFEDDTEDLAKTMARLNQILSQTASFF